MPDGKPPDNHLETQVSVGKERLDKDSIGECKYRLGTEFLSEETYHTLINRFGKESVNEQIDRILSHPYYGYDTEGSIARAIDNNDMATIEKRYRDSYSYRADRTLERREPWHDAIFEVDMHMEEYLKLKAEPHSIDEILEDIQAVMAYQNRGRKR